MAKQQSVARNGSSSKGDQKAHDGDVARDENELARYLERRIKPGLNSGTIPMLARSIAKQIARDEYSDADSERAEGDVEDSADVEDVEDSVEEDDVEEDDVESDDVEEDDIEGSAEEDDVEEDDIEGSAEEDDVEEDDIEGSAEEDDVEEDDIEGSAEEDDVESDDVEEEDVEDSAEDEALPDLEDLRDLQAELGEDWIVRFCVQGDDTWLTAEKDDGSQYLEARTASVLAEAVAVLDERGGQTT